MFDIGFAELLIIGVVGLLVIGPERLPQTIRTASLYLNRIRRGFNDIKREVQQELHNDAVMRELKDTGEQIKRETSALGQELSQNADNLKQAVIPETVSATQESAHAVDANSGEPGEQAKAETVSEQDKPT